MNVHAAVNGLPSAARAALRAAPTLTVEAAFVPPVFVALVRGAGWKTLRGWFPRPWGPPGSGCYATRIAAPHDHVQRHDPPLLPLHRVSRHRPALSARSLR